jgi:hypothetical protein
MTPRQLARLADPIAERQPANPVCAELATTLSVELSLQDGDPDPSALDRIAEILCEILGPLPEAPQR